MVTAAQLRSHQSSSALTSGLLGNQDRLPWELCKRRNPFQSPAGLGHSSQSNYTVTKYFSLLAAPPTAVIYIGQKEETTFSNQS